MDSSRSRRTGAGLNRSLSVDFVWPKRFGTGLRNTEAALSSGQADVTRTGESDKEKLEVPPNPSRKSLSSRSSELSLRKKRLEIEMEKKRQALEEKTREVEAERRRVEKEVEAERRRVEKEVEVEAERRKLENEIEAERRKAKIESEIRMLELEHQLQTEELEISGSRTATSHSRSSHIQVPQNTFITNWVNDIDENASQTVSEPEMEFKKRPRSLGQSNEIRVLCDTIKNVINTTKTATSSKNNEALLARQILDKDFPYFDGNPEVWPLFLKHFQNICSICNYSNEEILIKLQKSLKGDAKAAVCGMMLSGDNVSLIIDTLKMRFGRPELVLNSLISKIKMMPYIKETNLEKLINFSGEVNNLVCTVRTLKSFGHLQNPQLIRDLLNKIPDALKLRWGEVVAEMDSTGKEVNLEDFAAWLSKVAHAACFVSTPGSFQTGFSRKPERVFNIKEKRDLCYYCGEEHKNKICPQIEIDDVDTRWKTVTEKKLCFSCLGKNHQTVRCKRRKQCGINSCKSFHNSYLHKNVIADQTEAQRNTEIVYTTKHTSTSNVLLRMIPVTLYGPSRKLTVLALCDEASTVTLLDGEIATRLGLSGKKESLCLQWTNNKTQTEENSRHVKVNISRPGQKKVFELNGVRTIENLSLPRQTICMNNLREYPHLQNLPIADINSEKPVLLIGQNNIKLMIPRLVQTGPENGPVATKCLLGWSLHGPNVLSEDENKFFTFHTCEKQRDQEFDEIIRNSFATDAFGVMSTSEPLCGENARALNIMQNTARRTGERYEIGLLWKSDDIELPNNKENALSRLKCTERKCRKDEMFAEEYQKKIESYVEKGFVRKLSEEEADMQGPRTWYLPHFGVTNPNKPGKLRLVFDAAAKFHDVCLNDVLLSGPDLLQSLVAILFKFRQRKVAFCGDVREMFHQVRTREEDRCAQRFLWRDLQYDREPDVYEMMVMTFGATCSPVCAQYIKNLTAKECTTNEQIQDAIIKKFYVDDYLDSKDTEEEALDTILNVRDVLKLGGFEVVNWITNESAINEKLAEQSILITSKNIDDSSVHRVLGLWWDAKNDEYLFKLNTLEKHEMNAPTKRTVLRSIMSLFDPLGFIASFSVRGKILMQDIWRSGINWDEKLPENLLDRWRNWVEDLRKVTEVRIPRCYSSFIPISKRIEIHMFSDSSEKAFAAVAYLRTVVAGNIDVIIISARTRVAPLKPLSIPRLELQAAVMSSRLGKTILNELELEIDQITYWTDSVCVLNWIRGDGRKYKQFVAHRIGEIQDKTNTDNWRWVPTKLNVADEATRSGDRKGNAPVISREWINGPAFLKLEESLWPAEKSEPKMNDEIEQHEIKKEYLSSDYTCLVNQCEEPLPNITRFSNFTKLIRTTAWCMRFLNIIKDQNYSRSLHLTVEELQAAEHQWIKKSQTDSFHEEIQCLTHIALPSF